MKMNVDGKSGKKKSEKRWIDRIENDMRITGDY